MEQIRVLLVARRSAREKRIQSLTQLRQVMFCVPETIRTRFKDRYKTGLVKAAATMRPRHSSDALSYTTNLVIRNLARRVRRLNEEIAEIDAMLADLIQQTAPLLIELHGVGIDSAAPLLVAAGDNPDRRRSEGSWARLCGIAPLPANSGKVNTQYQLNRGGDRQANAALYRALTRMSNHPDTRLYLKRRRSEGLNSGEIIRCLKRHIARQAFQHLPKPA